MLTWIYESVFDSPNLATFVLLFALFILLQRIFFSTNRPNNLPPCPSIGLPFLGHLHLLEPNLSKPFGRFRAQLGDVYRLQFGNKQCVVISGFDAIKDALIKHGDDFVFRPNLPVLTKLTRGAGLVVSNGEKWKEHRRFTLSTLKDFGMGKSRLEGKIHEEIQLLFETIEAEKGRPFNPKLHIQLSVANIICSMIFGSTFKHGDSKFKAIIDGFEENLRLSDVSGALNFVPILMWLPGDLFKLNKSLRNSANIFRYLNEIIAEHKETHDDANVNDYIGAYVKHMDGLDRSGTSTTFSLHELSGVVGDLFVAGAETTSTTLLWSLPLLASHPEVQDRMFELINTHVGSERLPAVKDKANLAYVEAFYMEVLRYTNLIMTGIPRSVGRDIEFRGYHIQADTMVLFDMTSVNNDESIWTDPLTFRPSRFIDESGGLRKMEEFIPFSIGKRNCVGESLARMELLLFLSALVQRYELVCPDGADLSMKTIDGQFGTVHSPKPYEIIFRKR